MGYHERPKPIPEIRKPQIAIPNESENEKDEMDLDKIHQWYQSQGIDPWNFNCKHKDVCRQNISNFSTIDPPQIGKRYGDGIIAKLVIISSDAGRGNSLPSAKKLMLSERDPNVELRPGKKKHWSETLHIVKAIQNSFDPNIDLSEANSCFVHIRAVKCCANKKGSGEAPSILFKCCRDYLAEEVRLFEPEVIITQGNRAWYALKRGKFPFVETWKKCLKLGHKCEHAIIRLGGKPVLLLFTYHPTSRQKYYGQHRDGYFSCYPKIVKDFFERRLSYDNSAK